MALDINETDLASLAAQGYTEQDLSMLAKSEIAALLDVQSDDDGTSASDPHAEAAAEQEALAAVTDAAGNAAATEQAPETPFVPQYSAEVPADAKEQIAALTTEERDSFKKLMAGEIDDDEYQVVRDRTESAKDDLKTKALTASIFEQVNAQNAEQTARSEWSRSEAQAFSNFKAEGLDYKAKPALLAAYNTNLKTLGADPKNENRDAPWFLAEAHRLTKDDLGFVVTAKKPVVTPRAGVDPAELPPTLRAVPVAATGAVNADEFAHMRNLEGLALERAHAKLSNDQRDRWMAE
jgi:hypothetical protein